MQANLSRRDALKTLAAASTLASVPAAAAATPEVWTPGPGSLLSPLREMIREYQVLVHQKRAVAHAMDRLWSNGSRPENEPVTLEEIAERLLDYPPAYRQVGIPCVADLDRLYREIERVGWSAPEVSMRRQGDWARARAILLSRHCAYREWLSASGYLRMEQQFEGICAEIDELGDRISAYPCHDIDDILAKVDFALEIVEMFDQRRGERDTAILRSFAAIGSDISVLS